MRHRAGDGSAQRALSVVSRCCGDGAIRQKSRVGMHGARAPQAAAIGARGGTLSITRPARQVCSSAGLILGGGSGPVARAVFKTVGGGDEPPWWVRLPCALAMTVSAGDFFQSHRSRVARGASCAWSWVSVVVWVTDDWRLEGGEGSGSECPHCAVCTSYQRSGRSVVPTADRQRVRQPLVSQ